MMSGIMKCMGAGLLSLLFTSAMAQKKQPVKLVQAADGKKIDVYIGGQLFTSFLYPDTLEKPVLYPIRAANGTVVTRGFPLDPQPNDPTDHPHHIGLWLNFENVNGLDFWNNSSAIPAAKKHAYGWIKTDKVQEAVEGNSAALMYHANWTNQQNQVLLEENTRIELSGTENERIIDRITTLTAAQEVLFKDAKDGLLGFRAAHALEIPAVKEQQYKDDKGNITVVKAAADNIANGNYLTSEGKTGDAAWSTRAKWCKMYAKMGIDSISVAIIDHPSNINYPTYWHARGYGLFAANPLGERIFTKEKSAKDLRLQKGGSVTFRYRVVIANGKTSLSNAALEKLTADFAKRNGNVFIK